MKERGATKQEVIETVNSGERFPAKFDRIGFRRNFPYASVWRNREFATKQIEVFAVEEQGDRVVITVIVKYF
ncbi:hypothetical protein CXB77_00570 [Chromatium okenii]|uniref:DUF4258 domain-containing protein n=2 Tax=Chromatium okenii TaxID=61644 RepID=A0A2S7XV36_9GAMM|nr:hypothetical protein CXB77_14300 [Chromatium okenii]PQJ97619.1 hypothetical protein CXB77_00570 [Chromatium okenii]